MKMTKDQIREVLKEISRKHDVQLQSEADKVFIDFIDKKLGLEEDKDGNNRRI